MYINKGNVKEEVSCIVEDALDDWRSFLNEEIDIPQFFRNIYIMPLDSNKMGLPPNNYDIDFYLLREFETNIMTASFSKDIAVYCKFPRFCIWGQLQRENTEINYGFKIAPNSGILKFKKFNIGNGIESANIAENISNKLSDKVQDTMVKRLKTNVENLRDSELGRLLLEREY